MVRLSPRLVTALGIASLVLAGCASNEPPDYLSELRSADTTTSTAVAPTTTTTLPTTTPSGGGTTTTAAATTPLTELVAGDCVAGAPFSGDATGEATEASLAGCTAPHDGEVVGIITYTQGQNAGYPGQEQVAEYAEDQCAIAFGAYVGVAYGDSELKMLSLWPTEGSWSSGDREAVCVAFQEDAPLTASVAVTA